jgi:hypothetical protein
MFINQSKVFRIYACQYAEANPLCSKFEIQFYVKKIAGENRLAAKFGFNNHLGLVGSLPKESIYFSKDIMLVKVVDRKYRDGKLTGLTLQRVK